MAYTTHWPVSLAGDLYRVADALQRVDQRFIPEGNVIFVIFTFSNDGGHITVPSHWADMLTPPNNGTNTEQCCVLWVDANSEPVRARAVLFCVTTQFSISLTVSGIAVVLQADL